MREEERGGGREGEEGGHGGEMVVGMDEGTDGAPQDPAGLTHAVGVVPRELLVGNDLYTSVLDGLATFVWGLTHSLVSDVSIGQLPEEKQKHRNTEFWQWGIFYAFNVMSTSVVYVRITTIKR